jgi:hypothetical protein
MYGDSTGLGPADTSGEGDPLVRWRHALTTFNEAAKAACDIGEHQLQRLSQDAAARCVSEVQRLERQEEIQQRRLDGENPQAAGEEAR